MSWTIRSTPGDFCAPATATAGRDLSPCIVGWIRDGASCRGSALRSPGAALSAVRSVARAPVSFDAARRGGDVPDLVNLGPRGAQPEEEHRRAGEHHAQHRAEQNEPVRALRRR